MDINVDDFLKEAGLDADIIAEDRKKKDDDSQTSSDSSDQEEDTEADENMSGHLYLQKTKVDGK